MGCATGEVVQQHGRVVIVMVVPKSLIAEGGNVKFRIVSKFVHNESRLAKTGVSDVEDNFQILLPLGSVEEGQRLIELGIAGNNTRVGVAKLSLSLGAAHDQILELINVVPLPWGSGLHSTELVKLGPGDSASNLVCLLTVIAGLLRSPSSGLQVGPLAVEHRLDGVEHLRFLQLHVALEVGGQTLADLELVHQIVHDSGVEEDCVLLSRVVDGKAHVSKFGVGCHS